MPLREEEVVHVARLAHIGLAQDEIRELAHELSSVVDHFARLQEVNTSDIEPTAYVVPMHNVMRDDEVRPSWPVQSVLANAPRRSGDFFEIEAVLD